MKKLFIKNGRLLDPATGIDGKFDIVIMDGRIASMTPPGKGGKDTGGEGGEGGEGGKGSEVIDAKGLLVVPGLIDLHTHLREPGFEYKETIESGTAAAAAGGFTTVLCMANTEPVNDNGSVTRLIIRKAADAPARVLPVGAVSQGLRGKVLTEMAELKEAGCAAVSDDGMPVTDGGLMRRALEYSTIFDLPVISHAEELSIAGEGVMNEGEVSTRLGLKGIPNASEDSMVARDIALAELTGGRLHVAHVSTRGAVELIRAAKKRGVAVTAEATPHHLTLDHGALKGYDTNFKMSPPLRVPEDVEALRKGVADGTIDCIATDHAPHSSVEKDVEFDAAANGVVGLETALGLVLKLVDGGVLELATAIRAMTSNPARAMGLDAGSLKVGSPADVTIVDLGLKWTVEPSKFRSKGKNTPFTGWKLKGAAVKTILNGKVVYSRAKK
ncbi:MAG: dihydroorotase [Thermodesulfobacteriota bacterium]